MKKTKILMGMPITVEIAETASNEDIEKVFEYFTAVDKRYSTYKKSSEISKINNGLEKSKWSSEMKTVLDLCEQTKQQTNGYFDIKHGGKLDPSGLVKGWAINNAAKILTGLGFNNFYIDAGGDIQANGNSEDNKPWLVGIRNPFNDQEIIKVINVSNRGVATSGSYVRGDHIYNPLIKHQDDNIVRSISVVGPNIYEADRFATAAFAMGPPGCAFIDALPGFEAYMVDANQTATYTRGFDNYVVKDN